MSFVSGFVAAVSLLLVGAVMRENCRALTVLRTERVGRRCRRLSREVRR